MNTNIQKYEIVCKYALSFGTVAFLEQGAT